ncbi:MAG: hypothetical protein P4M12_12210 [Gammaproteobacteria bacterium]|nr:hypothetical protein [Gammaproteobacteria bacterium]
MFSTRSPHPLNQPLLASDLAIDIADSPLPVRFSMKDISDCVKLLQEAQRKGDQNHHIETWRLHVFVFLVLFPSTAYSVFHLVRKILDQKNDISNYNHFLILDENQTCDEKYPLDTSSITAQCRHDKYPDMLQACKILFDPICEHEISGADALVFGLLMIFLIIDVVQMFKGRICSIKNTAHDFMSTALISEKDRQKVISVVGFFGGSLANKSIEQTIELLQNYEMKLNKSYSRLFVRNMFLDRGVNGEGLEQIIRDFADIAHESPAPRHA